MRNIEKCDACCCFGERDGQRPRDDDEDNSTRASMVMVLSSAILVWAGCVEFGVQQGRTLCDALYCWS